MGFCISQIVDQARIFYFTSMDINNCFASYYQSLYSSCMSYTDNQPNYYLSDIDFPVLTKAHCDKLDAPITVKEVQRVLGSLQSGKTSSPDGIPMEFYKAYADDLIPRLHSVVAKSSLTESISASMSGDVIVDIPKQGKDIISCSSYHPISLLNADMKILSKILAHRLNTVITALIHPDQMSFTPGRGTDIIIQTLYNNTALADSGEAGVLAFLNAEKWGFL